MFKVRNCKQNSNQLVRLTGFQTVPIHTIAWASSLVSEYLSGNADLREAPNHAQGPLWDPSGATRSRKAAPTAEKAMKTNGFLMIFKLPLEPPELPMAPWDAPEVS